MPTFGVRVSDAGDLPMVVQALRALPDEAPSLGRLAGLASAVGGRGEAGGSDSQTPRRAFPSPGPLHGAHQVGQRRRPLGQTRSEGTNTQPQQWRKGQPSDSQYSLDMWPDWPFVHHALADGLLMRYPSGLAVACGANGACHHFGFHLPCRCTSLLRPTPRLPLDAVRSCRRWHGGIGLHILRPRRRGARRCAWQKPLQDACGRSTRLPPRQAAAPGAVVAIRTERGHAGPEDLADNGQECL